MDEIKEQYYLIQKELLIKKKGKITLISEFRLW